MQLINIGFGNIVSAERIISIVSPDSAPIKRIVQEAKALSSSSESATPPPSDSSGCSWVPAQACPAPRKP